MQILEFILERVIKTLWAKKKMLVTSIFSLSHNVLKNIFLRAAETCNGMIREWNTVKKFTNESNADVKGAEFVVFIYLSLQFSSLQGMWLDSSMYVSTNYMDISGMKI